jgi:hypothetical protein
MLNNKKNETIDARGSNGLSSSAQVRNFLQKSTNKREKIRKLALHARDSLFKLASLIASIVCIFGCRCRSSAFPCQGEEMSSAAHSQ